MDFGAIRSARGLSVEFPPAMNPSQGGPRWAAVRAAVTLAAALLPESASAFDSKGHVVIEALAYRTIVEGCGGMVRGGEVVGDVVNDGALVAGVCFGWKDAPPGYCQDVGKANSLLEWPKPLTDQPDAAFRRQFSDAGQCFHFMAKLEDAQTALLPGTEIPRATATSAIARCRDLADNLLRQIVIVGGPGTRRSGYGLYELMHSIEDSFSRSHSQRRPGTHLIEELRVWAPLTKLPGLEPKALKAIPDSAFHKWDDHRDKTYILEDKEVVSRRCQDLVDAPYSVPYECLSEEGDLARQAMVELLVLIRQLRAAEIAAPKAEPFPEKAAGWVAYKDKWFGAATPCEGAECSERQPVDPLPGAYGLVGLDTRYNFSRKFFDSAARGTLLK